MWKIQAVGSTISGYQNGNLVVQATDTKITSGSPGVWLYYASNQIGNWSGGDVTAPATYSVGGTVSGLSGTVVLQDNGGDDLSVSASGAFTFATALATGSAYNVTVKTNPAGQSCSVANGSGTVGSANVTNVAVTCTAAAATYSVGGTVSGLSGTVVLQDNGGDDRSVSASGAFTFATALATGSAYNVTVKTNPAGQSCSVANGSGTVGSANITNVAVTCTAGPATYSVGGTVSGLSGTVVLQDNGGDDRSVSASGAFTFATALATGSAYNVTVKTNPAGQSCSVANGSGTVGSANITNVAVTCTTNSAGNATDNFNRANGPLGANWTDISDGGLAISSQAAAGTSATGISGDMRTGENYSSDQYSQVEVTSTQLTGTQWIGPAVRAQNGGQDGYIGIYNWNNGSPELMLFKRSSGNWTELGSSYSSGPLAAGTQLKLMVVGSTLSFLENGVERIAVYDNTFSGGAPGIIAQGTGTADNWAGGTAGFEAHYLSTDSGGVQSYDMISASNGYGPQVLRVLKPTNPAAGVAHNFLFVLPVEAGLQSTDGDGMATLEAANAQNQYNLTIIEPSFANRVLVREQSERPELAVRDVHDLGAGALGQGEPGHQRQRAELADRFLQVRDRRAGPAAEAP